MQTEGTQNTTGRVPGATSSVTGIFEKGWIGRPYSSNDALKTALQPGCQSPATRLGATSQAEPQSRKVVHWNQRNLSKLAQHIVRTYHGYLRSELPRLDRLLEESLQAHPRHSRNLLKPLERVFRPFAVNLTKHMDKEEAVLFPWIEHLETATGPIPDGQGPNLRGPVRVLEHEHEDVTEVLREIRRLTSGYHAPPDTCGALLALYQGLKSLEEDLRIHIHLENNILFPWARRLVWSQRHHGECLGPVQ